MTPFGHAGRADRPGVAQHHHARRVALEVGVVDAGGQVVDVLEHDRPALVLEQARIGGRDLHHRPVRAQAAAQHDEGAACAERVVRGPDHLGIDDLGTGDVLADGPTTHGDRVEMQEILDLRHDGRYATGVEEVLHEESTRRLQVDEPGRRRAELVEELERQLDADPPGIRDEVQDRVRRARDRMQHANRVLESLAREDVGRPQIAVSTSSTICRPAASAR